MFSFFASLQNYYFKNRRFATPPISPCPAGTAVGPSLLHGRGWPWVFESIVLPLRYINYVIVNLFCVYFVYFGGYGAIVKADSYAVPYVYFFYGF